MKSKLLLSLFIISSLELFSQIGKSGVGTISTTNVDVNTRTYLTNNVNSGTTTLTVANSNLNGSVFSGNLASGDLIMIIQMQGASINTSNNSSYGSVTNLNSSGLYEIRCVASVPNSTTINVSVPLTNSYSASGKTQIIRVPRYTNFTLNASASIFPAAWNGNSGGVTVIEVGNNALINGTINATGRGFRGSPNDNVTQPPSSNITLFVSSIPEDGGRKGEGIAGSEIDYDAMGGRYAEVLQQMVVVVEILIMLVVVVEQMQVTSHHGMDWAILIIQQERGEMHGI
jgi:large repetitive protein